MLIPYVEGEVSQFQVINNRRTKVLKHSEPGTHTFDNASTSAKISSSLRDLMKFDLMPNELLEFWCRIDYSHFVGIYPMIEISLYR